MKTRGIDVSLYQRGADWKKIKQSGVSFVMIKASQGGLGSQGDFADPAFQENIEGAFKAGLKIGCYHFLVGITPDKVRREAAFFLNTIRPYKDMISLPCAVDLEELPGKKSYTLLDKNYNTNLVRAFTTEVAKEFTPCLYTNLDFLRNYLNAESLKSIPLWYARWGVPEKVVTEEFPYALIWQHGTEKIPGIAGDTDANYGYFEEEQEMRFNTFAEIRRDIPWAEDTIRLLVDKGYLAGSGKKDASGDPADLDLSLDMIRLLVINGRAGIYN